MSYMSIECHFDKYVSIDTECGITIIPISVCGYKPDTDFENSEKIPEELEMYVKGEELYDIEMGEGWCARLTAHGYMDQTPWSVYNSEKEAIEELEEEYGLEEGEAIDKMLERHEGSDRALHLYEDKDMSTNPSSRIVDGMCIHHAPIQDGNEILKTLRDFHVANGDSPTDYVGVNLVECSRESINPEMFGNDPDKEPVILSIQKNCTRKYKG